MINIELPIYYTFERKTKKATVQKQKIQKEKELELDIASILDSI